MDIPAEERAAGSGARLQHMACSSVAPESNPSDNTGSAREQALPTPLSMDKCWARGKGAVRARDSAGWRLRFKSLRPHSCAASGTLLSLSHPNSGSTDVYLCPESLSFTKLARGPTKEPGPEG